MNIKILEDGKIATENKKLDIVLNWWLNNYDCKISIRDTKLWIYDVEEKEEHETTLEEICEKFVLEIQGKKDWDEKETVFDLDLKTLKSYLSEKN